MVTNNRTGVKILDMAAFLPAHLLTNAQLAALYPEWPAEKIYEKTGIKERHIAAPDQTASDLAYEAAARLFSQGIVAPDAVDFVILCTQAPDYVLPTSACVLQDRLGLPTHAGALDVNLGCSGYVYGLSLAQGLLATGSARCVLLLTADTYSKYIHPMDKSVRTLFGDGATATALINAEDDEASNLGPFVFGTDGSGAKHLIVEAGMFRTPSSEATSIEYTDRSGNVRSANHLYMDGAEVMAFSLTSVPNALNTLLAKTGQSMDQIDLFVFHQANRFMLQALRKKLRIPEERFPIAMEGCGNTVSSTIPLALITLRDQNRLTRGMNLALIGFGVGYSWAACHLKY
ncbi:ketoacyl-ACP synthase III [Leptospira sp. 96542]|nr:ketoacyl-ACP synthase III [Leptospira sp. 96542]